MKYMEDNIGEKALNEPFYGCMWIDFLVHLQVSRILVAMFAFYVII